MNNTKNMKKRGSVAKSSRKNSNKKYQGSNVDSVPLVQPQASFKNMSLVFPPRLPMKLKFWTIGNISLAAALGGNYRWRPTGAFDIDPALGGTSMAGFAECAGFYATYRVSKSKIKVTVSNPSNSLPVQVIVLPMNSDPTNAFSIPNIVAAVGNPYSKTKMMGLLGSPATVVSNVMTTKKIFGDSEVLFDHNFTSLVTTVPNNNWFWNVCLYSPAVIATAFSFSVEMEIDIEFYDRLFLPA